jgi:hypothetical protein
MSTEMGVQRSTVVLVHGGWHGSWCSARVIPLLERRGLAVRAVDLPSIDADPDDRSGLSGDAAAVAAGLDDLQEGARAALRSLLRRNGDHEDGGGPPGRGSTCLPVCVHADAGESLLSVIGERAPWIVAREDGRWLPDLELAAAIFFIDCDAETQRASTARLRPKPTAPVEEPVPSAPWRDVPSTNVVCTQDIAIPVEWQPGRLRRVRTTSSSWRRAIRRSYRSLMQWPVSWPSVRVPESWRTQHCGLSATRFGECCRKLRTRADPELAVDAREVDLDRLRSDEERLRDLAVGWAFSRHPGNAKLARRQRLSTAECNAPRPCPGGPQLCVCSLGEGPGAADRCQLDRTP